MTDQIQIEKKGAEETACWSGVLAMTLCVFALAVLTSLLISSVAGSLDRKQLLLAMTALMMASSAVIALANSYVIYMTGRALIGVAIGGFWSMSAATALRLVPSASVPRALVIFNSGNALATVIAAPLGSYLGAVMGWRGAFLCLIPVSLVAFIWQWISLPTLAMDKAQQKRGGVLFLLSRRLVVSGMLGCGLFFMGQFALFTYLRPFLENITQVDVSTLSLTLLAIGASGFMGTLLIGLFLRANFYLTLIVIPVAMAIIAVTLIDFGHQTGLVMVLLALWGLVATAAPVGWWTWLARTLPNDAEAGGGLMVAVVQLSIALGSTAGGLMFDHRGYQSTFALSAALLLLAAFITWLTARSEKK